MFRFHNNPAAPPGTNSRRPARSVRPYTPARASDGGPRPQDVRVAPHHSYGMINNFAYIDCRALRGNLQELVPDIDERCPDDTALFKAIIARYNSLQDDDFVFEGDEGRAARHVFFPSGFFAADGRKPGKPPQAGNEHLNFHVKCGKIKE